MPITVTMPALSPTMNDGVISRWVKKVGDKVEPGDVLCEVQTDKATIEFEAIEGGYLRKIVVADGASAKVNQGIAVITESADEDIAEYQLEEPNLVMEEAVETADSTGENADALQKSAGGGVVSTMAFAPVPPKKAKYQERSNEVYASPLAKKIAKEKGLDLSSVKGSGPQGRVLEKDLEGASKEGLVSFSKSTRPEINPGTYEEEALTPIRKVIGERLQAAKMTIPHFYVTQEIHADRMMDLRAQLKEMGLKCTFNDFVLRATAIALAKHPEINSGYNSANDTIIRFKTVDISLAVNIPDGLITPIINHADSKQIHELSQEARSLAKKARDGALQPEEYQGGSFTVSNLGMFGVQSFDAVINPPQAAILAVGGILAKPIVDKGQVLPGHIMNLTISVDHRVIDGADAATFLLTLKKLLENPASLLL